MEFLGDVAAWFGDGSNWTGNAGMLARLGEHVRISVVAMLIALVIALPVGLALGHLGKGGTLAINISNVGRAIPSIALLTVAVQFLGLGSVPTYIALVALAVPPMITNAYVGIRSVDAEIRESARGMGLTGAQVLRQVELPLAVPLVMAGVRTAAVTVVATATLAALVGEGGLGRFILDGRAVQDLVRVFAGALAVGVLAVLTERGLGALQAALTPKGLRLAEHVEGRPAASLADAVSTT